MRRISAWFFTIFLMFVGIGVAPARAVACQSGEIDVTGDGSNCQTAHFTIGTTSDTTALKFTMSPKGTFYVDCGNGGTLTQLGTTTGSTTSGKTITRENNSSKIYTCTWDTAGTQSVRFGGSATQTTTTYSTSTSTAAISFYLSSGGTQAKVASVTGNMSAVFPYITANAAGGAQPRFYQTFYGATNLTTVPDDLFSNYTTGASSMFYYTFSDCTGLTSIPAGLFSNITTGAERMFSSTFNGCTGLTSIPAGLFSNITTGASYMFFSTFQRCTGLTSIPADLFSGITTGASSMFGSTFNGCTGLTSIPGDLFSGITTGAERMFNSTFYVCTNLSGYIPPTTFKKGMGNYDSMWNYAFDGTKLVTSCPCGTKQYITGYEGLWSSKVSCEPDLDVDWATCKTCGNGTTQFVTPGVGVTCAVPVVSEITLSATGADTAAIPSTVYLKYNTGWYSDSSATNAITGLTTLPTKSGKVFAGFYTGENGTGTRVIDENGNLLTTNAALKFADTATTVYAHFANGYNITYEMNSGTNYSGAPTVYIEGTGATIDGIPTKAGYTFTGWCTDSELQNCAMSQTIGTDATGDKTFYAKWSECTACAATNASCSLSVVNNTCTYTTSCNTGYGNIQNNGAYNASCSPNSYAITYTMNGGTNYSGVPESYTYGTGTTINGMPTKSGYTFTGWTGDNGNTPQMTVTIGTDATGAKSYTANWSECTACAATNASCSLSVVNNVCTYTTTCNTNYGNMTNSGEHNASCSPNSYAITYTMNGGTNYDNAPATYIYTTGATLNGVPTKANNVFIGWTGDNGDTPQMSVTIGTDATGAKAYTANWSECQACSATNATCSFDGVVNNVCTYTTACNTGYGNMTNSGAYNATCTANTYTCAAGKYLRVLDATCADCTAGNFCVGITNATYTGSDLGLGTCPNEYPNSATGASAQNQCYKACTTSNVEHSATVTGNDYYGDGVDTCEALTCATGYHVEDVPDLNSIIGATTTMNYNHDNNVMSFYVNYGTGKGTVSGKAQCSTRNVANPWQNNNSTLSSDHFTTNLSDNTGQYCYCQLNGYRPDGGSAQSLSAPWIYLYDAGDASGCALHCAEICGRNLGLNDQSSWDRLAWRAAAFNSVADFCNANNYTITYTMNGGTNYAGAPESYTYGTGATIDGVPTKTGNTFAGWCTDAELQNCAMSQTISASDTGSKAFYAKWNMGAYNITYELNGGTNYAGAPESYTYGTGATIDGVPTKTGYTFTGWTGSNGNTPQMTVTIGTDATDAKSYTANWSECPACAATNAICSFNGIVDNVCTYTTSCDDGYYIQNNGTYNASCSECGGNYYYCTGGTRNHVTAGYYSTGGTETTRTGQSQCASGYYCSSGVQNECPTGYGNSVAGATAQAQCYKPCTTADVEHSATVIGNNYYGTNGNMCEAETCVAGSHAKPGTNPNLERIIGDSVGTVESLSGSYAGTFTISYGEKGTITGSSSCSSANSQSICNCTLNSYTPQNGSQQTLGAPSMMFTSYRGSNYEYECFNNCLSICANRIAQNTTQRTQLFRSITDRLTTCEIETYNITYTMNGGTNYDNAPATYVYTTGATLNGVPTKAGYTFIGWTGSNGNTPQMTVTIGTGETGAKSYIANWSECTACAATNATCSLSVVNNVCTYTTACESGYEDIQNNGAYNASCSEPQPTECTGTNFYDSALNACTPCPYGYNYNTTSGKTSVTQCQAQCAAGTFVESPGIYGYTRLEYLESSGGQYINTGVPHTSANIRGEIRMGTSSNLNANVNIIGNQTSTGGYSVGWQNKFKIYVVSSKNRLEFQDAMVLQPGETYDLEYRLTNNMRYLTYDGEDIQSGHAGNIVTNTPIHLFDNGQQETSKMFKGRIYYIRIYEDDVLTHNYLPVKRDTDDAVGIYDTVEGKFFQNAGTGEFTTGNTITEPCVSTGPGYWAASSIVNFGSTSSKTACGAGTYQPSQNGTSLASCLACPADAYSGATAAVACSQCPTGYTYNEDLGKTAISQCQMHCPGGTYLPNTITNGYVELEYIATTGTQYIDTLANVSQLVDPIMSLTMQYVSADTGKQSGASWQSGGSRVLFKFGISNSGMFLCQAAGNNSEVTFGSADTAKHTFTLNAGNATCTIDNETLNLSVGDLSLLNGNILLNMITNEATRLGSIKIYHFQLISNNTVIRDMIPVRRTSDGALGMLDTVNNVFYGNAGSGDFIAGDDKNVQVCTEVGLGYWAPDTVISYGGTAPRTACEAGKTTMVSNASSSSQCVNEIHSYNVTYSCGTGTGTPPSATTVKNETTFTPAANPCTHSGNYIFAGWGVSDTDDVYPANTSFIWEYTEDKTLTAQWVECSACSATNATCSFSGIVNNVCTYTTACNTGYGNMQNSGAYNASCSANVININWNDDNGDLFEAGSCTYGGAITTPTTAPVKRGYTFTGWRFSLPQS